MCVYSTCMYMYMYISLSLYIYIYVYVYVYMYMYVCVYIYIYIYIIGGRRAAARRAGGPQVLKAGFRRGVPSIPAVHVRLCMHSNLSLSLYIYIYIYVYIYIYIYIIVCYIYTYTYIYIYIYIFIMASRAMRTEGARRVNVHHDSSRPRLSTPRGTPVAVAQIFRAT